ncbi:hypothetical protein BDZ89DRAFT_1059445, partial [Hymenopellis radicata]
MFYRFYVVVLALILVLGASAAPVTSAEAVSATVQATRQITLPEAAPTVYGAKFEWLRDVLFSSPSLQAREHKTVRRHRARRFGPHP